jgi:hypothetical protein
MNLLDHLRITKEYTPLEPTTGAQRWFGVSPCQRKGRAERSRHEGRMLTTRPRTTTSTAREITDWSAINLHANGERQRVGGLNATTFVNDRYKPGWSASLPMHR